MTDDDFVHVRRVVADSRQGRLVLRSMQIARQAWRHSRLHSLIEVGRAEFTRATVDDRTRSIAIAIAVAAAINAAARMVMPPYSAPAVPTAFVIVIATVAAVVAAAPAVFMAAWRESRLARLKQR